MLLLCPLCSGSSFTRVLDRARVPVFQNAVLESASEAQEVATAKLAIRTCEECGFVFNAAFDSALASYDANYENDQTTSGLFVTHVDAMARKMLDLVSGVPTPMILEVGCGQGAFLRRLAATSTRSINATGFDPAWRGGELPPGIQGNARVFDADAARSIRAPIDAVVSRHVIEHVPDPVAFLRTIRGALPDEATTVVCLETPCVDWILEGGVIQDFFFEHCSYFSQGTLGEALRRAGFGVQSIEHVFGGQYLWAQASTSSNASDRGHDVSSQRTRESSRAFADRCEQSATRWSSRLEELRQRGAVALWGAGAKGVTFAGTLDEHRGMIDCLIDLNPRKQGKFTPMTGHPIVSPDAAAERGVRSAIIMNPNYRDEIAALVSGHRLPFELLDG